MNIDYFKDCVDRGGRVRTEILTDTTYRAVCSIDGNVYYDETRTKLTKQEKRRRKKR